MHKLGLQDDDDDGYFSKHYNQLWKMVIQPKRNSFGKEVLGGKTRRFGKNIMYVREEGSTENNRGERVEYSFYKLHKTNDYNSDNGLCLIYMHAHGGNRLEGINLLPFCAKLQVSFCAFDFSGSGNSGGHYCTLGYQESDDCQAVIQALIKNHGVYKFILWGRSMGAVAVLLHASRYAACLKYLVLDSPFHDVEQAVKDIGNSYISLGEYVSSFVFNVIKEEILKRLYVDFTLFKPIDYCGSCVTPCIFLTAEDDTMVLPDRVAEMMDAYRCREKSMVTIKGDHMSTRINEDIDFVFRKIASYLKIDYAKHADELSNDCEATHLRLGDMDKSVKKIGTAKPSSLYKLESFKKVHGTDRTSPFYMQPARLTADRDLTPSSKLNDSIQRQSNSLRPSAVFPINYGNDFQQAKSKLRIFDVDDEVRSRDHRNNVQNDNEKFSEYLYKGNPKMSKVDTQLAGKSNNLQWPATRQSILQNVKESNQINRISKTNNKLIIEPGTTQQTGRNSQFSMMFEEQKPVYQTLDAYNSKTNSNVNLSSIHSVYTPFGNQTDREPDRTTINDRVYRGLISDRHERDSSVDYGRHAGQTYTSMEKLVTQHRPDSSVGRLVIKSAANDKPFKEYGQPIIVKAQPKSASKDVAESLSDTSMTLGWRKDLHIGVRQPTASIGYFNRHVDSTTPVVYHRYENQKTADIGTENNKLDFNGRNNSDRWQSTIGTTMTPAQSTSTIRIVSHRSIHKD